MKKLVFAFSIVAMIIMIIITHLSKQNEINHKNIILKLNNQKFDIYFNEAIPSMINDADNLSNEVKKSIIKSFDDNYGNDKQKLKKEFQDSIVGNIENSKAIDNIGNIIKGKTLNNVGSINDLYSDNNDLVIWLFDPITKKWYIIGDTSKNCAVFEKIRNYNLELSQQSSVPLFKLAYMDISRGNKFTFWNFLPIDKSEKFYDSIINFKINKKKGLNITDLEKIYVDSEYNDKIFETIEILISNRIYDDVDYFGVKSEYNNGTFSQKDMSMTVSSGFNVKNQLEVKRDFKEKIDKINYDIKYENNRFAFYSIQYMVYISITILLFILLFLFTDKRK